MMARRYPCLFALLALASGLAEPGRCSRAGDVPGPGITLFVKPLRDAGGLTQKGPDGRPLNVRYTAAIRSYLADMANGRFAVVERPGKGGEEPGALRLTLEGELSGTEADGPSGGSYLCSLRLFQEGKPRRLVAQWSGGAATLRDLTGNLRRDPRIHPQGLLGEMGTRILRAIEALAGSGRMAQEFRALLDRAERTGQPNVTVVLGEADARAGKVPGRMTEGRMDVAEVPAGTAFRLRVSTREPGSAFLVEMDAGGAPHLHEVVSPARYSLFAPEQESGLAVTPEQPVFLPPGEGLRIPDGGPEREFVALVRRKRADTAPPRNTPPSVGGRETAQERTQAGETGTGPDIPGVQIISGGRDGDEDTDIAMLLRMATADPPGVWTARRVRVRARRSR
jgi:hypothetical protein